MLILWMSRSTWPACASLFLLFTDCFIHNINARPKSPRARKMKWMLAALTFGILCYSRGLCTLPFTQSNSTIFPFLRSLEAEALHLCGFPCSGPRRSGVYVDRAGGWCVCGGHRPQTPRVKGMSHTLERPHLCESLTERDRADQE